MAHRKWIKGFESLKTVKTSILFFLIVKFNPEDGIDIFLRNVTNLHGVRPGRPKLRLYQYQSLKYSSNSWVN